MAARRYQYECYNTISKEMCDSPDYYRSELPDIEFEEGFPKEDISAQNQAMKLILGWASNYVSPWSGLPDLRT